MTIGGFLQRCLVALVLFSGTFPRANSAEIDQDAYVFRLAGCASCHTRDGGDYLAGGKGIKTPFGTFFAPNITPHMEQGIGKWNEVDLERALVRGVAPNGDHYYPVFPYTSYARMTEQDAKSIYRHLRSIAPNAAERRAHEVPWLMGFRVLNWFWKLLFFDERRFSPVPMRSKAWNRGAYITLALAHCGECHSPRNIFGAIDGDPLSGNPHSPSGSSVPNITSHSGNGIGAWSPEELVDYLTSGALPDGDYAGGAMARVIEQGLRYLKPEDADGIAQYLKSIPARASLD